MYFYDIERNYSILPEKVVLKKIKSFKNQYPNPLNIVVRGKNDQSNVLFNVLVLFIRLGRWLSGLRFWS